MTTQLWMAADIAHAAGVTRQRVTQWAHRDDFPKPVATTPGGTRLWSPTDVRTWLTNYGRVPYAHLKG